MLKYLRGTSQPVAIASPAYSNHWSMVNTDIDESTQYLEEEEDAIVSWPVYEYTHSGTVQLLLLFIHNHQEFILLDAFKQRIKFRHPLSELAKVSSDGNPGRNVNMGGMDSLQLFRVSFKSNIVKIFVSKDKNEIINHIIYSLRKTADREPTLDITRGPYDYHPSFFHAYHEFQVFGMDSKRKYYPHCIGFYSDCIRHFESETKSVFSQHTYLEVTRVIYQGENILNIQYANDHDYTFLVAERNRDEILLLLKGRSFLFKQILQSNESGLDNLSHLVSPRKGNAIEQQDFPKIFSYLDKDAIAKEKQLEETVTVEPKREVKIGEATTIPDYHRYSTNDESNSGNVEDQEFEEDFENYEELEDDPVPVKQNQSQKPATDKLSLVTKRPVEKQVFDATSPSDLKLLTGAKEVEEHDEDDEEEERKMQAIRAAQRAKSLHTIEYEIKDVTTSGNNTPVDTESERTLKSPRQQSKEDRKKKKQEERRKMENLQAEFVAEGSMLFKHVRKNITKKGSSGVHERFFRVRFHPQKKTLVLGWGTSATKLRQSDRITGIVLGEEAIVPCAKLDKELIDHYSFLLLLESGERMYLVAKDKETFINWANGVTIWLNRVISSKEKNGTPLGDDNPLQYSSSAKDLKSKGTALTRQESSFF